LHASKGGQMTAGSERGTPRGSLHLDKRHGAATFQRGVISVSGGTVVSLAVLLVESVIVARVLPVADMGVYVLFQVVLSLLTIAVDFGFKTSAAQFISAESSFQQQANIVNSLITLRLVVIGAISVPILLAGQPLSGFFQSPGLAELMRYMPIVLLFSNLDELEAGMLQGFHRYQHLALAQILRSALRLTVSTVVLLVMGWGLPGLLISWIVSFAVSSAYQWLAIPVRWRLTIDWNLIRRMLAFGMPLQMTRYLWFAMQRIDTFVISVLIGPVGVAMYDVAGRLPQGLQRLWEAYAAVYHPSLSSKFAQRDLTGSIQLIERSLRLFNFATLFFAWATVLVGKNLIVFLFKQQYAGASTTFVVMSIAFSLSSSINLLGYALTAYGRPGQSFAVNLVRSVISFGGDFALVPIFGFVGAAYATLLSQLVSAPLAWWYLRRERLPVFGSIHLRQFILTAAAAGVYFWLPPISLWMRLALIAVFPVVAVAFSLVSLEDLKLVVPERFLPRPHLGTPIADQAGGTKV
jgi:O-antigen/teichoic acid export membrane protein